MVPEPRSAYAFQFFLLATVLLAVALSLAFGLISTFPNTATSRANQFSIAFAISTTMLLTGSWCLFRAVESVRRERQPQFRHWLQCALAAGTAFVGVQTFALSRFIIQTSADDAEMGTAAFVTMVAGLHGIHFIVALLFLCFVTIQAMADRYDHEYFWGVTICAWFWHALGLAWLAILFVILTARFFSERRIGS